MFKVSQSPGLLLVEWWNLGFMSNSVLAPCGRKAGTSISCLASSAGCQVPPTIGTMAAILSGHLDESRPSPPIQCRTSPRKFWPGETEAVVHPSSLVVVLTRAHPEAVWAVSCNQALIICSSVFETRFQAFAKISIPEEQGPLQDRGISFLVSSEQTRRNGECVRGAWCVILRCNLHDP